MKLDLMQRKFTNWAQVLEDDSARIVEVLHSPSQDRDDHRQLGFAEASAGDRGAI
jgi:hypothetical protein